jgi:thymidine phosphorylase
MIVAQGADLAAFEKKLAKETTAPILVELKSPRAGCVTRCDARRIGEVIRELGGGRLTREAAINFDVGVDQIAKPGEQVKKQSVLARIHAADARQAEVARTRVAGAFTISPRAAKPLPLVAQTIV